VTTDGVLLLDKPAGISSNAALQRVRRLYGWSKAGHTGTLDPLATGLLPICLGEATKFSHSLLDANKSYQAVIRLGFTSSTGDAEGLIEPLGDPDFTAGQLAAVLDSFLGPIDQIPPMHSALKKDGKPLYRYARSGETVVRPSRKIMINSLQLIENMNNMLTIAVGCSKGTYIRVLAQDIGNRLGCGGYLLSLRRTGIRELAVESAIGLGQLEEMDLPSRTAQLLPVDRLVGNLPSVYLSDYASRRIVNGLPVSNPGTTEGLVTLYDSRGMFMGVGQASAGTLIPKRLVSNHPKARNTPLTSD
jgi:tRNA pseudouridine55 synthase